MKIDMNRRCSIRVEHVNGKTAFRIIVYGFTAREARSVSMYGENFGGLLSQRLAKRGIILCEHGGPWMTSLFHVMEDV